MDLEFNHKIGQFNKHLFKFHDTTLLSNSVLHKCLLTVSASKYLLDTKNLFQSCSIIVLTSTC